MSATPCVPEPAGSLVRYRLLLLGAALLFSTGGAAIKAVSLNAWQIASFRSAVAAVALWVLMPAARRNWNWRMLVVGVAYAATLVAFVNANKLTTSANAIYLQATAPIYLLAIGPLLLRERIRRADVLVTAAVGAGALLLFFGDVRAAATAPRPALGNLFGAFSGVSWALTIAGLRWLGRGPGAGEAAASTVIAGNAIACLAALPAALPVKTISMLDVSVILYLGVFQIGLAYWMLTRSIRRVPALEASTLLLAEPAFNPAWSWWLHGERPGAAVLAGGATILCATLAGAWWTSQTQAVSQQHSAESRKAGLLKS